MAVAIFATTVVILFPRAVARFVLPDQTVYTDGFSDDRFSMVRPGMTEQEVLDLVGRPLEVYEIAGGRKYRTSWSLKPSAVANPDFRWWSYSKPGRYHDSFHIRSIRFGNDGRVQEVDRSFYND